jgi:hypothetical protein
MAKKLADLQKQLAALAGEEDKNAKTAEQLNAQFAQMAQQAGNLQMLPRPIADQMQQAQQTFDQMVSQAMRDLTQKLQQGSNPKEGLPDLKDLKLKGDRLAKELQGIKDRLDAMARARKGMRDELAEALRQLQREMLNQVGGLTDRELKELRYFLAKMREDLKILQERQANLAKETEKKEGDLATREKRQIDLDKELENMLASARKLLDAKKKRRAMDDDPEFPDAPYTPDGKEVKVPPKEQDGNEPLPGQKDKPKGPLGKAEDAPEKKDMEEKEPLFMPALSGDKPVLDPRFAKKQRPVARKPADQNDPDARREELRDRQDQRMQDLDAAIKSLGSDQDTLDRMMNSLESAMRNSSPQQNQAGQQGNRQPNEGQQPEGDAAEQAMQQLAQMLQSPRMREAMAMASRMRQAGRPGQQAQNQPGQPQQAQSSQGNLHGGLTDHRAMESDLSRFDPASRAVLLKMQPQIREEILQGMRERGPEAYEAFIQDYFKRLTESKAPTKP